MHAEGRGQRAPAARHAVRADPLERSDRDRARVGALVAPFTDPFSGQPENKATPAAIAPHDYVCRGFVLSRRPLALPDACLVGARRRHRRPRLSARRQCRSCGLAILVARARAATMSQNTRISPAASIARRAFADDRIELCLFIGPAHEAGEWDAVKACSRRRAHRRAAPHAAVGQIGDGLASAGPIVCACFGVGRNTICDAIAAGACSVAEIGARLKAGTNCGSCIPELKRLIAQAGRLRRRTSNTSWRWL